MGKANPVLLVIAAILLLGSAECFAAGPMDAQAMECCASTPCTPGNHSHDCCKSTVSLQSVYVVPPAAASAVPLAVAVGSAPPLSLARPAAAPQSADASFAAFAHGPPLGLYAVYHSWLI